MNFSQSSLTHAPGGICCGKCGSSLAYRMFHRVASGHDTYSICCPCYVGEGTSGAEWHPECMATAERNRPASKFKVGDRVRHRYDGRGWPSLAGKEATVRYASYAGGVNWSYALNGERGDYAWVAESELEAVIMKPICDNCKGEIQPNETMVAPAGVVIHKELADCVRSLGRQLCAVRSQLAAEAGKPVI